MEILVAIIIMAFLVFTHWTAHHLGRLAERGDVLRRATEATEIFFANVKLGEVANWRTASELLGYVAGADTKPTNPKYEGLTGPHWNATLDRR